MLDRRADCTSAAERMADQVGFRNPEMVEQRRDVVAHCDEGHRPVRVRRAAVALHLHRDHLPYLRQRLYPSLHLADRRQPAMDQHQRFALAVDLVIELDAVHISVAAARRFHLRLFAYICLDTHIPCGVYQEVGICVRNYCGAEPPRDIEPPGLVRTVGWRHRASTGYVAADSVKAPARPARGRFRGIHGGRTASSLPTET